MRNGSMRKSETSHTSNASSDPNRRPSAAMDARLSKVALQKERSRRTSGQILHYSNKQQENTNKKKRSTWWVDDDDDVDDYVTDGNHTDNTDGNRNDWKDDKRKKYGIIALIVCVTIALIITIILVAVDMSERGAFKSSEDDMISNKEPFDACDTAPTATTSRPTDDNNDAEVLVATTMTEVPINATVSYQCTFRNLWTPQRQPLNFPIDTASWAGPILWTHTWAFEPFQDGSLASPGVEQMAEFGLTTTLKEEMQQREGWVLDFAEQPGGTFPVKSNTDYFTHLPPIRASQQHPYLSMMATLRPSPDWFTGFHSFRLLAEDDDESNNDNSQRQSLLWYDHIKIQTYPWDAGTNAGQTYNDNLNKEYPIKPAQRLRHPDTAPPDLEDANGQFIPALGELECLLVPPGGDDNSYLNNMPDCDYFANPCCVEEASGSSCGSLLPNRAVPNISCAVQEVIHYQG